MGDEKFEQHNELDFGGRRKAIGFLSQELLEEHYEDHSKDFGTITIEE
ncbi:hypothetical protein ACYULU_03960 [Breznakiellaceae bacterium SP9]